MIHPASPAKINELSCLLNSVPMNVRANSRRRDGSVWPREERMREHDCSLSLLGFAIRLYYGLYK